jgi:HEAT repeat protein
MSSPRTATERRRELEALPATREALPDLLSATLDPSPEIVRFALRRIATIGDRSSAPVLRDRMLVADISLVRDFARALAALGDDEARLVAAKALREGDSTARMTAAAALEELATADEVDLLTEAVRDSRAAVRRSALRTLGGSGEADWQVCAAALSDADASVRAAAVSSVANLAPDPAERLSGVASDRAVEVRRAAAAVASKLAPHDAVRLLSDPDRAVREAAVRSSGARQAAALTGVLSGDRVGEVRREAARRLGELDPDTSVGALIGAVADPDPQVRVVAVDSLQALLGRRGLIDRFIGELDDPDPKRRRAVIYALTRLRAREAGDALAARCDDPDPETRIAMIHFAGEVLGRECPLIDRLAVDPEPAVANAARIVAMGPAGG